MGKRIYGYPHVVRLVEPIFSTNVCWNPSEQTNSDLGLLIKLRSLLVFLFLLFFLLFFGQEQNALRFVCIVLEFHSILYHFVGIFFRSLLFNYHFNFNVNIKLKTFFFTFPKCMCNRIGLFFIFNFQFVVKVCMYEPIYSAFVPSNHDLRQKPYIHIFEMSLTFAL